jgi:hypothetical protein
VGNSPGTHSDVPDGLASDPLYASKELKDAVNDDLETEHPEANLGEADRRTEVTLVDGKLVVSGKFERRVPPRKPKKHPPAKIAKRLAFAHQVERAIHSGRFRTSAAAARAFGMSPSEMTRLLDLTLIAPNIQEEISHLMATDGVEPDMTERALRPLAALTSWAEHRAAWPQLLATAARQLRR